MELGPSKSVVVRRVSSTTNEERPDEVIVEEPLSIRLDGTLVATTMRTPGNDFELAVGFLHAEGMLEGAEIQTVRHCGEATTTASKFNTVSVDTACTAPPPTPRLGSTSSSCGICGTEAIETLTERLVTLPEGPAVDPMLMIDVANRVRDKQELFARTGSVHAAAAFDASGTILLVREDIGRHNAVDKVVGRLAIDEALPTPGELALYVSGRASFEMVQKAWAAGFGTVVSVSAPSALAIDTALAANIELAGFIRDDEINIYSPRG